MENGIESVKENSILIYQNEGFIPSESIELIKIVEHESIISLVSGEYNFIVEYK